MYDRSESVIFYVDPKPLGLLDFLGKERIRFPVITSEHSPLTVFGRKFAGFAGLKAEVFILPFSFVCFFKHSLFGLLCQVS